MLHKILLNILSKVANLFAEHTFTVDNRYTSEMLTLTTESRYNITTLYKKTCT